MFSSLSRVIFHSKIPTIRPIISVSSFSTNSILNQAQQSASPTISPSPLIPNESTTSRYSSNKPQPKRKEPKSKKNEKIVAWKLYGLFNRHNTRCSLVAVVEDLDFMQKNDHLSYNEKVLYYLQLPHKVKYTVSAGQLGFRKTQRQEYEAGFQVAAKMFKTIEEKQWIGPSDKVELILKNFGKGREAFKSALLGKEGYHIKNNIVRISDATTLKFGGVRSKRLRRL